MADSTPKSYHTDPTLYMYTSLTSGSSQIITATSRLQTILKANKIDFQALDTATDEKARMLWGRRGRTKKLPGLVRYGMVIGDIDDVEEWNEYGELKEQLEESAPVKPTPTPSAANTPSKPPTSTISKTAPSESSKSSTATPSKIDSASAKKSESSETSLASTLRQAGLEAAKKATDAKSKARAEAVEASKKASSTLGVEKLNLGEASAPKSSEGGAGSTANPTADSSTNPESEVLEGSGQAKAEETVPSAKEAEERANQAIIEDESEHVHIAGSPPPVKRADLAQKVRTEGDEGKAKEIEESPEKEFFETAKALVSGKTDNQPATTGATNVEGVEKSDTVKNAPEAQTTKTTESSPTTNSLKPTPSDQTKETETETPNKTKNDTPSTSTDPNPAKSTAATTNTTTTAGTVTNAVDSQHPQVKTQDQPAASGDLVGETVAD